MKQAHLDAAARLRTADPAGDLDVEPWPGSTAQQRAAAAKLADAAGDAPVDLPHPSPTPRLRRVGIVLAAAVLVLGLAALISQLHTRTAPIAGPDRRSTTAPATRVTGTGKSTPGPTNIVGGPAQRADGPGRAAASNRRRTVRLVEKLLAAVRVPADAHVRSNAPVKQLQQPFSGARGGNLVQRTTWWVAPGTVAAQLSQARRNIRSGFTPNGSGSATGPGTPTLRAALFDHRSTSYAEQVNLQAEAVAIRNGVAVRVDVQAVWIPKRPAYSFVHNPTSAYVVVDRNGSPPTVRRTVDASTAADIARAVNSATVSTPGVYNCPADFPNMTDAVNFSTTAGPIIVRVELTGCGSATVDSAHHRPVGLDVGGVDAAVRAALDLPKSYAR